MKRINSRPSHASLTKNFKLNPVMFLVRQLLLCLCLLMSLILLPLSLAQANDFTVWTDSTSNPLFGGSTNGVNRAYYPSAIKVGSVYHIWYGDGTNTRHASSTNFNFSAVTFPAPAVTGLSAVGPYHPRVLYNASGWNIGGTPYAGPFLMYYTDGTTWASTRVAHSADGSSWTDIGPCIGVHSFTGVIYNFDVLYEGGTTWKAYADNGGGQIEYYISIDGINWTGTAHNILSSLQPWESYFTSPHVIKSGSQYIMYYGSGGPGSNQGIGVAFSTDGQNFAKSSSNPIFSTSGAPGWRNDRTYTPYVIPDGTSWIMYYTGRSTAGVYSVGYALPTPPTTTAAPSGGTYSSAQNITLTCNDGAAGCQTTYYCTVSGCNPTTVYSGAINITSSTVLRFYSKDDANNNESAKTETYTINIPDTTPPTTTASPSGGTYSSAQNVTLSCNDVGGSGCQTTRYCLGSGCTPSTTYSGAINLSSSNTLRFYSTDNASNNETVKSEIYTINLSGQNERVNLSNNIYIIFS